MPLALPVPRRLAVALAALALSACAHSPPPVRELALEPGPAAGGLVPFVQARVAGDWRGTTRPWPRWPPPWDARAA